MKIILAAINAKYIHSNLGVYSLRAYAKMHKEQIQIKEYTINQYVEDILADLYKEKADFIAFSCYIWNIEMVEELVNLLYQLRSELPIWVGGPEVSYDAMDCLKRMPGLTGVMKGEGEAIFTDLMAHYVDHTMSLEEIPGITYRDGEQIVDNPLRGYMDINEVPFIYEDMADFENKIIYYETSRGCPFSCSYCLSSIDKRVRLRNWELVEKELQFFIDHQVPQVKFVDRTFNCNKAHAMRIWQYIHEHDQGMTNFHFEIGADLLDDEELALLAKMRPGLVQLEIGVQSTYEATIQEVARTMKLEKLSDAVARVNAGHNIHQHLDLIAGLPFEGLERFKQSFNDVFAMKPEQLQLGFLKVLKGSRMHLMAKEYGIVYRQKAPYEVLKTKWLSYDELLCLKGVENMVEVYYNTHQFELAITYLLHFYETPYDLFAALAGYYEKHKIAGIMHGRMQRYDILRDFVIESETGELDVVEALMLYDLYARENLKSRPKWAPDTDVYRTVTEAFYKDDMQIAYHLPKYKAYTGRQIKRMTHMEYFPMNLEITATSGRKSGEGRMYLFDYLDRDPLNYSARIVTIDEIGKTDD